MQSVAFTSGEGVYAAERIGQSRHGDVVSWMHSWAMGNSSTDHTEQMGSSPKMATSVNLGHLGACVLIWTSQIV